MAFDDDDVPAKAKTKPRDLSPLSVAELEDYIAALRVEIVRAQQAISAKQSHRSGAESIFKR